MNGVEALILAPDLMMKWATSERNLRNRFKAVPCVSSVSWLTSWANQILITPWAVSIKGCNLHHCPGVSVRQNCKSSLEGKQKLEWTAACIFSYENQKCIFKFLFEKCLEMWLGKAISNLHKILEMLLWKTFLHQVEHQGSLCVW